MLRIKECLIIDDDKDDQEIFLLCIRRITDKVNCTFLNDGIDALALLKTDDSYTPDYIFLDVNMPKMNGIECLKMLRNIPRLSRTKIFMYSTSSEIKTVERSRDLGADDFIVKPTRTHELKEKLSAILEIVSELQD